MMEALHSAAKTVYWIVSSVFHIALVVVPYTVAIWPLVVSSSPGATFAQQVFLFLIISLVLAVSIYGFLLAWMVGWLMIILHVLFYIWSLLG